MYEDRVGRGVALLDRVRPGWEREVSLDDLAMETCDQCLLGQIWGSFDDGWVRLLADLSGLFRTSDYGFTLRTDEQDPDDPTTWDRFRALGDTWRSVIRRRLEARP